MIYYNVTINIEDEVHQAWLQWMQQTHLPEVMATGFFLSHSMSKLLSRQPDETGTTYVIQYLAKNMADYEKYRDEYAPALQQKTTALFNGKFVAFRTLMEKVI